MSELLDLLLAGLDQPQADQPNSLAEGLPMHHLLQISCPCRQYNRNFSLTFVHDGGHKSGTANSSGGKSISSGHCYEKHDLPTGIAFSLTTDIPSLVKKALPGLPRPFMVIKS
eukprot:1153091-Pelagomonas_calceolata.AAC.3